MTTDKSKRRRCLEWLLRTMAQCLLKKYHPKIVSITGSVGKTSTKEAIFSVLQDKFRVRRTSKNFNNEIGLPLTIIGADSGNGSFLAWLGVFAQWLKEVLIPQSYPEILILEMGADRPGDIKYLTSFVASNIGVITDISQSHIEFFKSLEAITREKGTLVRELSEEGLAILNVDNTFLEDLRGSLKCRTIGVGFSERADLQATDIVFNYLDDGTIRGISFKLNYDGTSFPVRLSGILARHQIYSALIALGVAREFGMNLIEASHALTNFQTPTSRLSLFPGIRKSMIIDDTYNSSPTSAVAALEVLEQIRSSRKIVVFGDILELGARTEEDHRLLADAIIRVGTDYCFAVGPRMQYTVAELKEKRFGDHKIFSFDNPTTAGRKLRQILQEGDLILVKGSQGMRMEKVIEEIMAEPEKAPELVCRQSKEWRAIPF